MHRTKISEIPPLHSFERLRFYPGNTSEGGNANAIGTSIGIENGSPLGGVDGLSDRHGALTLCPSWLNIVELGHIFVHPAQNIGDAGARPEPVEQGSNREQVLWWQRRAQPFQ